MKIKALGTLYPTPTRPLSLGEQRRLKREFGFIPGVDEMDLRDPDHMSAFLYAAMRESDPDTSPKSLLAALERVTTVEFTDDDGKPLKDDDVEAAAEESPTSAPDGADGD